MPSAGRRFFPEPISRCRPRPGSHSGRGL